jgi:hypothetical protein
MNYIERLRSAASNRHREVYIRDRTTLRGRRSRLSFGYCRRMSAALAGSSTLSVGQLKRQVRPDDA